MSHSFIALAAPIFAFPRRVIRCSLPSMIALHRSRRALSHLDDARLRDVGLSRSQAEAEVARPLWDAPASWKQ